MIAYLSLEPTWEDCFFGRAEMRREIYFLDLSGLPEPRNEIPNGVVQRSSGLAIGVVEVDHDGDLSYYWFLRSLACLVLSHTDSVFVQ